MAWRSDNLLKLRNKSLIFEILLKIIVHSIGRLLNILQLRSNGWRRVAVDGGTIFGYDDRLYQITEEGVVLAQFGIGDIIAFEICHHRLVIFAGA
jgi:hypothetical protein